MKKNKFKLKYILFIIFLYLIFMPINFIIENDNSLKIFSTGININFVSNSIFPNYKKDVFAFYKNYNYDNYLFINHKNSLIRFNFSKNIIQKQKNRDSASIFLKSKNIFNKNNVFSNKDWLLKKYFNIIDVFKDVYSFDISLPEKQYVIYFSGERSYNINPYFIATNSLKDLTHEMFHYSFNYLIKNKNNGIWSEILCETNSLIYLFNVYPELYKNELNLKSSNYYSEIYGKNVLTFLETFNYNFEEIIKFEKYLLKNYDKLSDKEFNNLIKNWSDIVA